MEAYLKKNGKKVKSYEISYSQKLQEEANELSTKLNNEMKKSNKLKIKLGRIGITLVILVVMFIIIGLLIIEGEVVTRALQNIVCGG